MSYAHEFKTLLAFTLICSFFCSSGIAYFAFSSSSSSLPEEIETNVQTKILDTTVVQARQLASKFDRSASVVKASSSFAQDIFNNETIPDVNSYYHDETVMTPPPDTEFDSIYNRRISRTYSAYKIAKDAFELDYQDTYYTVPTETENPLLHINSTITNLINESAKMDIIWQQLHNSYPEHIWLYMGFEAGLHRSFPWHGPYSRSYDPRARSWYVGAVTGAKDIVCIMDSSGSMGFGGAMENTKLAMKNVLATLGPRDSFNVLTFSSDTETFKDGLSIASPTLISEASSFVDSTVATGSTNINKALIDALSILKTHGNADRTPVIIFMTDGLATIGETITNNILENIEQANTIGARIFVFGLGNDLDYTLLDSIGDEHDGATVYVYDSEGLINAMNRYYQFFKSQIDESINWSWPYVDASGWGLVITVSQAVIVNDEFIGVVATDLHLQSLVTELEELKPSKNGYNFIFDSGGIAVVHPSFTDIEPGDWQEEAIRVPIEELETTNSLFTELKDECISGKNVVKIITYNGQRMAVAMSSISDTSLHLGTVTPVTEFLDKDSSRKLEELEFYNFLWFLSFVAINMVVIIILYMKNKNFEEDRV